MRTALSLILPLALFAFACGGTDTRANTPEPSASTEPAPTQHPTTPEGMRALTEAECKQLADKLVDSCTNLSGLHSAQVDGWCSALEHNVADGAWVTEDCQRHMRRIDLACFDGTTGAGNYMTCDESVDRSH